jgi:DNA-binding LacI/PurR family transcriptional regulator
MAGKLNSLDRQVEKANLRTMQVAVPEYARIKRKLIAEIESGHFTVGGPIPSEAQLSAMHHVSRATVVRSLQELALEGYLFRQKGRGTFVADFRQRTRRRAPVPLFIYEGTYRMSGSGRQLLLRIMSGIEDGLGAGHPGITVRQVPSSLDEATRAYIDENRPPVALIIEPSFNVGLIAHLQRRGCVTWVINEPTDDSNCLYINQERAGYLATRHLISQGRRRIALLNGPLDGYWGFRARFNGYTKALSEASLAPDPALHRQASHTIDSEAGRIMFRALLDERVAFDGVVGVSDSKAMGAMALAQERGLNIPRDVAFVSIDNMLADQADPALSAVALPFEEMGRQVALRVLEVEQRLANEPSTEPAPLQQICLQPSLIDRAISDQGRSDRSNQLNALDPITSEPTAAALAQPPALSSNAPCPTQPPDFTREDI